MGELLLVLLGVAVVCGGIPILIFAYSQGKIEIPRWVFYVGVFLGISITSILRYPLNLLQEPIKNIPALIVYILIGRLLRKEYKKSGWKTCFLTVFVANIIGIFVKYMIIANGMVHGNNHFALSQIIVYLVIVHSIVFCVFMITPENTKAKGKATNKKKPRR